MPSTYQTLRKGAQGNDVSGLQNTLRNAGYQLNPTGIYDDATENAVKQYQKQNKLTVDGIAGDQTLSSLYGTNKQQQNYGYTPSPAVQQAKQLLDTQLANKPGAYQGKYGDQISSLIEQIQGRQPFQYDAEADPLYQFYKDQYIMNGQRAMQDTMGQAAALTGGYGNSYAASAGQQAYNQTLEGLNNIIPELEQRAYQRYNDEGDRLLQNYSLLQNADESAYGRYRDAMTDYMNERQMAENSYLNERNFDYGAMSDLRNLEFQREMTEGDRDFQREMTNAGYDFQREMTERGYDFQREQTAGDRDFQREMTNAGYDFQREQTAGDRDFQREMTNAGYDFQREMNADERAFQEAMTNAGYNFQREMNNTEYQRNLDAQTKEYAYNTAMSMINAKKMPSDELLAAAGLNKKDVETWLGLNQQQQIQYVYAEPTTKKKSSSKSSNTNKQETITPDMTTNAKGFMSELRTPDEYQQRKDTGSTAKDITSTQNYKDYLNYKVTDAYNAGKLTKNEVAAISMYYADFLK